MSVTLTNRLKLTAEFVRENRLTVDVGTDHGYLPAFLVLNGVICKAIAADIGVGPLENARKTVEKYSLEENIQLILSNGLEKIPVEAEEIVIAGMGGTLIAEILENAPWIKNENVHLILQPMTHSQDVRQFLWENGFYIDEEKTCFEGKRVYIVISAYYNGKNEPKSDAEYYFGKTLNGTADSDKAYVEKQTAYLKAKFNGTGEKRLKQILLEVN